MDNYDYNNNGYDPNGYNNNGYDNNAYNTGYTDPNAGGAFDSFGNPVQNMNTNNGFDAYGNPINAKQGSSTLAIISLVCGILSLVLSCCCTCLNIPLAIAGLVCGILAIMKKQPGKGMAIGGVATSGVGILIAVVSMIISLTSGSGASTGELLDILQSME